MGSRLDIHTAVGCGEAYAAQARHFLLPLHFVPCFQTNACGYADDVGCGHKDRQCQEHHDRSVGKKARLQGIWRLLRPNVAKTEDEEFQDEDSNRDDQL